MSSSGLASPFALPREVAAPAQDGVHTLPTGPADLELEWFFTAADADMGTPSNYMDMLVPARHRERHDVALERRVEAARARRTILGWLSKIEEAGGASAGVLAAAYAPRAWPEALLEELGRATGVVVRLAAAEAGLPDEDDALEALEHRTAVQRAATLKASGPPGLEKLRTKANGHLARAFAAYRRVRGDEACVVGRWS